MAAPVSIAQLVTAGIEAHTSELYVARPGKVTAYDPLTNTAVVQPMIKHALTSLTDGERVYEELPEIPFVPVMFPRVGTYVVTMPVPVGTPVLLLFNDVSLAEWRNSGGLSEPVDARRHSLGWPVALLGLYPDTDQLSQSPLDLAARTAGMVVGEHGGNNRIEIAATGIKLGGAALLPVALGPPIVTFMAAVAAWIAAVSPKIITIPAPLTGGEQAAVTAAAGAVATAAGAAATTTNATATKAL